MIALALSYNVTRIACNGAQAVIRASALGGTGPYTYSWASPSNSNFSVVPQAAPLNAFAEGYDNGFSEASGAAIYSLVCAGGVSAPISSHPAFTPAHEGYCSLVIPEGNIGALLQAGCTNCIDTSQVTI